MRRRRPFLLLAGLGFAVLVAVLAFGGFHGVRAGLAGNRGKSALLRAERHLSRGELDAARRSLEAARRAFVDADGEVEALGPLRTVARRTPVVGTQVAGTETLVEAGIITIAAGLDLVNSADEILESSEQRTVGSGLIEPLQSARGSVAAALPSLEEAVAKVASLDDDWLIGPLGDAQATLATRLPEIRDRVERTEGGLGALATFIGGSGPRRYLFLSQNPDEVRPTGGFIGTYGVLSADGGRVALERFEPISDWTGPRPEAVVPGAEAGSPFRFSNPPLPQTLGNVNSTPDWPRSASLAAELWQRGGEEPVDGVVSFVPSFLARLLRVLGPVEVPEYGETVAAGNLEERFEFYTEQAEADPDAARGRKDFVATLAGGVTQRILDAPTSKWQELGRAVGKGFDAREAVVWSTDDDVAASLAERRWDGAFPQTEGDFFYNGEFSYAAKNGNGLERTFDHDVDIRPDGSARITTSMKIANTEEPGRFNASSLSYVTVFGPEGATLAPESDPPLSEEPAVAGHPAFGWLLSAPPLDETSVKVVWEAPDVARLTEDGWEYSLTWPHLPGHSGDRLNLNVDLPGGWAWDDEAPPSGVELDRDFSGSWMIDTG